MLRMLSAMVGAVLATTLLAVSPAQAAFPGRNGEVAFVSELTRETTAIEAVRLDGSARRTVCACDGAADLAFSPDGLAIAFAGFFVPGVEVIQADGTNRRQIRLSGYTDDVASVDWSPGSSRLLVADLSGRDRFFKLWSTAGDGSGRGFKPITRKGEDRAASWSTTGLIAFERHFVDPDDPPAAEHGDLWVMRARGGGLRRLTWRGGLDPDFSPHGKWIVFERGGEVWAMLTKGGGLRRVTNGGGEDPAFSSDGKLVAFIRGGDLWVTGFDGSGARMVASHQGAAQLKSPTWQPLH
jgi:Tol biopolymer transport system component